jgi:hypothetical protein
MNHDTDIIPVRILRWLARIWSLLSILLISILFLDHLDTLSWSRLHLSEWIGLIFYPCGIVLGLILGWFHEGRSGMITLASLAGFYIHHLLFWGRFPGGLFFLLLAFPGLLFGLLWIGE